MNKNALKLGFYWVKFKGGSWRIAELIDTHPLEWAICGSGNGFKLADFETIGKRVKEPK